MKLTESQKKLADEVAEAAPSTEKAKEQLETEPEDEAPSYPEPKEKTPQELQERPEAFLDRLDEASKDPGARLAGGPKVGDRVLSPYGGRPLTGGGTAPEYGVIRSVKGRYAYINFGVSSSTLTPWSLEELDPIGAGVWKAVFR